MTMPLCRQRLKAESSGVMSIYWKQVWINRQYYSTNFHFLPNQTTINIPLFWNCGSLVNWLPSPASIWWARLGRDPFSRKRKAFVIQIPPRWTPGNILTFKTRKYSQKNTLLEFLENKSISVSYGHFVLIWIIWCHLEKVINKNHFW